MKLSTESTHISRVPKWLALLCAGVFCVAITLGLVGCGTSVSSSDDSNAAEGAGEATEETASEEMTGTITEISETELLVEAASDTNDYLQGPVRVDITEIDDDLVKSLEVGDTVEVRYSGAVGMSEPPFIAAITLGVI